MTRTRPNPYTSPLVWPQGLPAPPRRNHVPELVDDRVRVRLGIPHGPASSPPKSSSTTTGSTHQPKKISRA